MGIINYHNGKQIYDKTSVDELLSQKQDAAVIDTAIDPDSEHAVQNKAIAEALKQLADDCESNFNSAKSLVEQETQRASAAEDAEKDRAMAAEAALEDAIKAAHENQNQCVKIGDTMFWPQSENVNRIVGSDQTVTFTFDGQAVTAVPEQDVEVKTCVARNVPEGWAACDGTAKLKCEDYPELAKFFRGTRNEDGTWNCDGNNVADDWKDGKSPDAKIWIPYCAQRIIKISY